MAARHVSILFVAALTWTTIAQCLVAETRQKKRPVPSDAAQAQAMKLVKELYAADYAKADTLAAKQALAKTLLDTGKHTQGDAAGQFVLLKLARDVATQALDGLTAFQAVDAIAETFDVDPIVMKAAVLTHGASHATTPEQHRRLMEVALSLIDPAIAEDNYSVAKDLCDFAASEAVAAHDADKNKQALERGKEVDALALLYDKAQNAAAMLREDPINPEANAAYGKYLCFVKGDWNKGILMLALGSDVRLKAMAQSELTELSPTRPEQVGDDWWDASEKEVGFIRYQIQHRAAYWYREALPQATGLAKIRLEKRLDSVVERPATAVIVEPLQSLPRAKKQPTASNTPSSERTSWTVQYTWTEQVQRFQPVNEFNPQTGKMRQYQRPYMATVHHNGTKTVKAKLVSYDHKTGKVVLNILEDKDVGIGEKTYRYAALGKEDKKYLDSIKDQ